MIVTWKSVVGQQKSSKQMIMGGSKCRPAQQGLAHAFDDDAAAGCVQQDVCSSTQYSNEGQSPPLGTGDRMPRRAGWGWMVMGQVWCVPI